MPRPTVHRHRAFMILALAALGPAGCATSAPLRGAAGPVAWEIVDIKESVALDWTRWDYTLVFRETEGRTVQFERVLSDSEITDYGRRTRRGARAGPQRELPFRRRLNPHGELRVNRAATLRARQAAPTLTVFWRFEATDDTGRPVMIDIKLPLTRGVGRRAPEVAPPGPLPPARTLEARELSTLAGQWRGHYRDPQGFATPVSLRLSRDGSFEAAMDEPVRARFQGRLDVREGRVAYSAEEEAGAGNDTGTLTFHEGGGKRVLAGNISAHREAANVVQHYELDPSLGVFVRQPGPTATLAYTVRLEAQP